MKLFLVQWLGGPTEYSDIYGHPRHRRSTSRSSSTNSRPVAGCGMRGAMLDSGVPADLTKTIFEALAPLAQHMINANENVPRDPILETFMN